MMTQSYCFDGIGGLLLGRPPFLPFALAASALASDLVLPPREPSLEKCALMICLGVIGLSLSREVGVIHARRVSTSNLRVVTRFKAIAHSIKRVPPQGLRLFVVPNALHQLVNPIPFPVETVRGVNGNFKPRTLAAAFNFRAQLFREFEDFLFSCHRVSFRNQQRDYNPSGLGCQIGRADFEGESLISLSKSARKNIYFLDLGVKGK